MSKILTPTEIRKQLLSRGYEPLPNRDKRCLLKKWSTVAITEQLITGHWSKMHDKATGLRLGNRLAGADCDISLYDVLDEVKRLWADAYPDVFDNVGVPLLERGTTASCKVAYFFRIEEPFGRIATRDFRDADGGIHKVEIFGGKSKRQFGAFGAHSLEKGTEYVWPVESPLDVDISALPELTEADVNAMVAIADDVMVQAGLTPVVRVYDDTDADVVYDLTDKMEFESGDSVYTLDELKEALKHTDHLRLTAGWHDPSGVNATRCIARLLEDGALMITDFGEDGRKHMEVKQGDAFSEEEVVNAFAKLGTLATSEPPKKGDTAAEVIAKLLSQFVYCRSSKTPVISLSHPNSDKATQQAFVSDMAKYQETRTIGNKEVIYHPGKIWLNHPDRISVLGVQMRPDRPRPLYWEDGGQWVNSYRPPVFAAADAGDAAPGIELMEQLAPEPKDRKYFLQMLAHKLRHPEVPGPATINVANDRFGSGRGTLGALLGKLFGDAYVQNIPFTTFAGQGSQGQYNAWMFDSLFVLVNETMRLDGKSYHSTKHDTYEVMKERLEPRAGPREMAAKYGTNGQRLSFCTYVINTNSMDSIPIPANDRRCFVLENGDSRTPEFWERIYAWMENPANIAAFAAWLYSIDLSDFKPYATPPMTAAKEEMAEAGASPIDRMVDEALRALQGRSELFSVKHVEDAVSVLMQLDQMSPIEGWREVVFKTIKRRNVHRVGVAKGVNWQPKIGERRFATFAWTKALAKKWTPADAGFVRKELERCGPLDNFEKTFKDLAEALARSRAKAPEPE